MSPRAGRAGVTGKAGRSARASGSREPLRSARALSNSDGGGAPERLRKVGPREHRKKSGQPFIVLTGLSGSGKSQAIRALEDLGYFCVDNLPTTLIPTLPKLSLQTGGDITKGAIGVDGREGGLLSSFAKVFGNLRT